MATEARLVLTATRAIRGQVVATAPAALKRTFTLLELAALLEAHPWGEGDAADVVARAADWRASVSGLGSDLDVPDPIGRSPQVHRAAADLADRATRVIAAWLG
jgi:protein-tyrosine phosphatase